ncbi:MAG: EAL domain-containing protein [Campylobacterales bacterium]|nr:EAL domain-containing protein [Campylobacterales bacterium]
MRSDIDFKTLFETARDAIMLLDEKGFIACNRSTLNLFGCTSIEEFCSFHPAQLSPELQPSGRTSLSLSKEHIAQAYAKGERRFEWLHHRLGDGSLFDAEVTLTLIPHQPRPLLQAIVRDISEQKGLKSTLQTKIDLLEKGPVAVFRWRLSEGWPVEYVSSNVEVVLGISYHALRDNAVRFSDFIHPEDLTRIDSEVSDYLAQKEHSFHQEYRMLSSRGEIWVEDFSIVDYNEEGRALGINGYLLDISAKKKIEALNAHLLNYDPLTALPNRQRLSRDIEAKPPHSCALFNIDDFTEINDFFGMRIGDSIIIQVGSYLQSLGYKPYRLGGDEFGILFYEEFTISQIEHKIHTILEMISEHGFMAEDQEINVSMTAGIALGSHKVINRADIALHLAKEKKLQLAFYEENENIENRYRRNIEMTTSIKKAILDERIICHYQPIFDLATKSVQKYEALVRMIDEEGNLVPPGNFLFIAKKTKLYQQITKEVIKHACATFRYQSHAFSINLSATDLLDPTTVQEIIKNIVKTGTASRVVFEILESEGIENYDEVALFIAQVKSLGAKIAIDDFGTGYSNFENILKLNVDFIKIDGSLIKNITTNPKHAIIVETIVEFAKKIGAKTIAEFVADDATYEEIERMGIDFAQGYFIGKPEPI